MAIADTITSMQTHTSNAYTMIGYGTDLTGINKNLENLSSTIFNAFLEALRTPDTLFTNLPKKSGTGANITLNDTANAPMRIELGARELTQAGTPTPSSPQDIHTISGSNTIKVNGKNLAGWKTETINGITLTNNNDGSYTLNGTSTANANFISTNKLGSANRTLSIQVDKAPSGSFFVGARNESLVQTRNITISTSVSLNTPISTSGNQVDYLTYIYIFSGITLNNVKIYIQLENGGSFTSFKPYTSQEADIDLGDLDYCKIGNYEDKFIRTSGKNLFDGIIEAGYININTGENTGTSNVRTKNYIAIQPNTQYTISSNTSHDTWACYYNSSKTFISNQQIKTGTSGTFTTPANAYYIRWYDAVSTGESPLWQLEVGSTSLPYEPYGSNEWYIKKNIGKVVLDGTSAPNSVDTSSTNTTRAGWWGIISSAQAVSSTVQLPISNYFVGKYMWASDSEGIYTTGSDIVLRGNKTSIGTTTAEIQTWLSTHNTIVYYVLATPTYTQITGTLAEQLENVYKNMLSQKGQTNISQINDDLPFDLDVSALEDIS